VPLTWVSRASASAWNPPEPARDGPSVRRSVRSDGHPAGLLFELVLGRTAIQLDTERRQLRRVPVARGSSQREQTTEGVTALPLRTGTKIVLVTPTPAATPGIRAGLDVVTGPSAHTAAPDFRAGRSVVVAGTTLATCHPSPPFRVRALGVDSRPHGVSVSASDPSIARAWSSQVRALPPPSRALGLLVLGLGVEARIPLRGSSSSWSSGPWAPRTEAIINETIVSYLLGIG
jgi:hypothetical protein